MTRQKTRADIKGETFYLNKYIHFVRSQTSLDILILIKQEVILGEKSVACENGLTSFNCLHLEDF